MDKTEVKTLIDQYRRRWQWPGTDCVFARRAERACLALAVGWEIAGLGFVAAACVSGKTMPFLPIGLAQAIGAVAFFWQSRRFGQARVLLVDSEQAD